ncbi:unnamed protein product, partial [Rotaria magnacalcarata]
MSSPKGHSNNISEQQKIVYMAAENQYTITTSNNTICTNNHDISKEQQIVYGTAPVIYQPYNIPQSYVCAQPTPNDQIANQRSSDNMVTQHQLYQQQQVPSTIKVPSAYVQQAMLHSNMYPQQAILHSNTTQIDDFGLRNPEETDFHLVTGDIYRIEAKQHGWMDGCNIFTRRFGSQDFISYIMTTRLLNHWLSFPKVSLKRLNNTKSYINLGTEMKLLNDKKQFEKALAIFDQHGINNITTLSNFAITQVLKACAHMRDIQRGKIIHNLIASETKNDIYVSSTLIHMYVHCGDMASAQSLLDSTKTKTPSMYGIMMKGYIKNKQANKANDLFNEIENPNDVNVTILFNACAQLKTKEALDLVKKISKQIPKSFYSNPYLLTSLLDALMKCGDVAHAESLFYSSKQKVLPMYGAMMKGYVDNNLLEKAIDLFNKIENPNDVNVTILFNACAQLKTKEALDLVKKISKQIPKSFYS